MFGWSTGLRASYDSAHGIPAPCCGSSTAIVCHILSEHNFWKNFRSGSEVLHGHRQGWRIVDARIRTHLSGSANSKGMVTFASKVWHIARIGCITCGGVCWRAARLCVWVSLVKVKAQGYHAACACTTAQAFRNFRGGNTTCRVHGLVNALIPAPERNRTRRSECVLPKFCKPRL